MLASNARWRPEVVAYRRAERTEGIEPSEEGTSIQTRDSRAERRRYWTWVALKRLACDLDVLRWPRCSGRMKFKATIDDPAVIQRILAHLELPGVRDGPPAPAAASAAPFEQRALPSVNL